MEAIITSVRGTNISVIEDGLKSGSLIGRVVTVTDIMPLSDRNLKADINEQEVEILRALPEILQVERIQEMENRLKIQHSAEQPLIPTITWTPDQNHDNWALSYCTENTNTYRYSHTGEGVDVVIMDSGITVGHTEFNDGVGASRIQQIEWKPNQNVDRPQHYTDTDGHGTHVAGTVAGLTQGWARDARIYSIKIFDTDAYSALEALQLVRTWHNAKSGPDAGRPTVINNSWGYFVDWPTNYPYDKDGNPVTQPSPVVGQQHPVRVASIEAEIQSLTDAGVIVVSSAGNQNAYIADTTDSVYNDYYRTDASFNWVPDGDPTAAYVYYYKRTTPGESSSFCVGSQGDFGVGTVREISDFSNYGTAVDIFAPGVAIQSALNDLTSPGLLTKMQGTSMASPQVAGMAAVYLSQKPDASETDVINYFDKFGRHDTITDIEYNDVGGSTNISARSTYNGLKAKDAGEWKLVQAPKIKIMNEWKEPKKAFRKEAGQWVKVYG